MKLRNIESVPRFELMFCWIILKVFSSQIIVSYKNGPYYYLLEHLNLSKLY